MSHSTGADKVTVVYLLVIEICIFLILTHHHSPFGAVFGVNLAIIVLYV